MTKLIFYDEENKVWIIYTLEHGGPIIHDPDLNKAEEKFKNAMELALAVKKLLEEY